MRTKLILIAIMLMVAAPATAQTFKKSDFPLLYAGANYDQGGRVHAAAEAWFFSVYKDKQARVVEIIGGFKPDGTAKIGAGFGLMAGEDIDTFVFADVRVWSYAQTTAGGVQGGGFDGGAGVALMHMLFRVGYGMSGTTDHPFRRGLTAAVSLRLWPE